MPVKKCEVCGSEFHARLSAYRTCGVQCRNRLISSEREARHKREKSCVVCESTFEVGAKDKGRQTCSEACGYELRVRDRRTKQSMLCVTCGTGFLSALNQVESGGGKYCSKTCMYDRNKTRTSRPCVVCGKEFSTPPSQMHVKTCSTECGYQVSHGENSPRYKGLSKTVVIDGIKRSRRTGYGAAKHALQRRSSLEQATPQWADQEKIRRIYEMRDIATAMTGIQHHVDHLVPLNSDRVCGLHVENNLQVSPALDNISKGNRSWPDM